MSAYVWVFTCFCVVHMLSYGSSRSILSRQNLEQWSNKLDPGTPKKAHSKKDIRYQPSTLLEPELGWDLQTSDIRSGGYEKDVHELSKWGCPRVYSLHEWGHMGIMTPRKYLELFRRIMVDLAVSHRHWFYRNYILVSSCVYSLWRVLRLSANNLISFIV